MSKAPGPFNLSNKHKYTGGLVRFSDPFHVAEDEDEQSPEENGNDSSPDEDNYLHVRLVT